MMKLVLGSYYNLIDSYTGLIKLFTCHEVDILVYDQLDMSCDQGWKYRYLNFTDISVDIFT